MPARNISYISKARVKMIASRAKDLWSAFLDEHQDCSPEAFFRYDWLFDEGAKKPVHGAERFFGFCSIAAKREHNLLVELTPVPQLPGAVRASADASRISRWVLLDSLGRIVSDDPEAEQQLLDAQQPTGSVDVFGGQDDAAWDPGESPELTPHVLILKYTVLPRKGPTGREINPYSAWTWNTLHECGHVVLHAWDFIAEQRLYRPPDEPIATPGEEEEAWFFAASIIGLALGSIVYTDRTRAPSVRAKGNFGAPWEDVAWQWLQPSKKR